MPYEERYTYDPYTPKFQRTDPAAPSYVPKSILGYDPLETYKDYVKVAQKQRGKAVLEFNDWYNYVAQNAGVQGLVNLVSMQYASATGHSMPDSVRAQVMQSINSMPDVARQQLMGAGVADTLSGGPFAKTESFLKQYMPIQNILFPSAAELSPAQRRQQAQDNSNSGYWRSVLGREPSPALLSQMRGMSDEDIANLARKQTYKNGLTLGQWQDAEKSIGGLYQQYFGRAANDQEITWAAGKTSDQITEHIMDSDSRIAGIKMRQFVSFKDALDKVSMANYGMEAPDHLIKDFNASMTAAPKGSEPPAPTGNRPT